MFVLCILFSLFFSNDPPPTEIYTLSLHDALPICSGGGPTLIESVTFRMGGHSSSDDPTRYRDAELVKARSEEHTSELQSLRHLVCRLLLEKKKKTPKTPPQTTRIQNTDNEVQ